MGGDLELDNEAVVDERAILNIAEEVDVLLIVEVTDPVATVSVRIHVSGVRILATVVREAVLVGETKDALEVAVANGGDRVKDETVVAEDRAAREGSDGGRDLRGNVNVEVVDEELGVPVDLLLHDRAVHVITDVHEDTDLIAVAVHGALATVLPVTVDILADTESAVEVALEAAEVDSVGDATRSTTSLVAARESAAVNAVIIAVVDGIDAGLAAVGSVAIAVRVVGHALEDAVTTSLEVSGVTVAVGDDSRSVDLVERGGGEEDVAVERGRDDSRVVKSETSAEVSAELVKSVEALNVAEVLLGLRAAVRAGATGIRGGRLTDLAPAASVLATVTRIAVAILVVVEAVGLSAQASRLERASAGLGSVSTTLAEDLAKLGDSDVLLLGEEEILGPDGAVELTNGSRVAGNRVSKSNLATVLPVAVDVLAESGVARNRALNVSRVGQVASRLGDSKVVSAGEALGLSTREVDGAVDARARVVADSDLATVGGITVAVLEASSASELALTIGNLTILTTAAVDGLQLVNRQVSAEALAIEPDGAVVVLTEGKLLDSVAESHLAAVRGLLGDPIPTNLGGRAVHASREINLTTVTRVTVAVLEAVLALIVASTSTVATTDAVEREVKDGVVKVVVETLKVEGVVTLSLIISATEVSARKNVAPGTLANIRGIGDASTNVLRVAANSADTLTDVVRGELVVGGVARSITLGGVRTHQRAVEGVVLAVTIEVVGLSLLATVQPRARRAERALILVLAAGVTSNDASVEVASVDASVKDAAEAERRGSGIGVVLVEEGRVGGNGSVA